MGRLRLGSVVWLGMILAGACVGAFVFASWPESTIRVTRLPYGESMPKTPAIAAKPQATPTRVVASAGVTAPQTQLADEETETRELAGPPPIASEAESDDGYVPETPEELGAKPLPGMDPSAAKPAPTPATEAPTEEEAAAITP